VAYLIETDDCIDCGACEVVCPNKAIYMGGVGWKFRGVTYEPISEEGYYIVPEKCIECIGFSDYPLCVLACPVDCIIPDPEHRETKEELIAKKLRTYYRIYR